MIAISQKNSDFTSNQEANHRPSVEKGKITSILKSSLTEPNTNIGTTKKTISFNPICQMFLVPSRAEYMEHGVNQNVWWSSETLKSFKIHARRCIAQFRQMNNDKTVLAERLNRATETIHDLKQRINSSEEILSGELLITLKKQLKQAIQTQSDLEELEAISEIRLKKR